VVGAARRSRELITEACLKWNLPDVAGPAHIVVTELVNNVVSHAHTAMEVLLARHGDTISVAVRDHSGNTPRYAGPVPATAYGGRGLLLIDSVSQQWGCLRLSGGKVVWAVLLPEPSPDRPYLDEAGMADPARG
jgi:two-component sensor histidine kinase